jgi:hypothetical protein
VGWIKIISYQMLKTTLYPIGTNKQNNIKNQFLLHLEVLVDSFCFHESHASYSTFPWNKKNLQMLYRIGGLVICKRSCLFETSHELCTCIHIWLYTYIHRFYYPKYCWKFFYISDNFRKRIKNNIKRKTIPIKGFELSTYCSHQCFVPTL